MKFIKMQAAGNDYIYVDLFRNYLKDPSVAARSLSARRFGVGGDGLVAIAPSKVATAKMTMFNADGSEGKTCGNALRCVGKYLFDSGLCHGDEALIETSVGIRRVYKERVGERTFYYAEMGKADFSPAAVPFDGKEKMIRRKLDYNGKALTVTALSVGNPHAVVENDGEEDIYTVGALVGADGRFKEGVNVELASFLSDRLVIAKVLERGSGVTLSCGTGACAVAACGAVTGRLKMCEPVTVRFDGGDLKVVVHKDTSLTLGGECHTVYKGETDLC